MTSSAPPIAPKHPVRIEQLSRVRTDDYAWMKDDNWQKVLHDPAVLRQDVRTHLLAENAYTEAVLAETRDLQATLFEEMKGRVRQDDSTVPMPDGPWQYYVRYAEGQQHPVHARSPRGGGDEDVLLDVNAMAEGHEFFKAESVEHSADHTMLGWAEDDQGSEVWTIRVKDIATGNPIGEAIENTVGDFLFTPCGQWLFWVQRDECGRAKRVYRRPVAGKAADDVLIYEEPDDGFFLGIHVTGSEDWIVIGCGNQETSEVWLIPASDPLAMPRVIEPRTTGLRYGVEHWDGRFIIRTNADGATDFKLMSAPIEAPGRANWIDWLPHRPGYFIVNTLSLKDHFIRLERVDANSRIVVTDRITGAERPIDVAEEAYVLSPSPGFEYDTTTLRYMYQSPAQPAQWWDIDLATGEKTLRKTQEIPSGHDPSRYVVKRLFAPAADGQMIPVTVLMRRDVPVDGRAPMFLYGYGSYGFAMEPGFSIPALNLVERGWVYAIAHVRGGSEKGWGWFLDGRGATKQNTFTDFVAVAEHLIAEGYTAKGRIVAHGRSAGGLLMGAITNLRPDLWAGVAAGVPFVDVLNTMSDTSLPLTPPEWPEWGNPLESETAYDTIAAYSPYDRVEAKEYPPVLAMGGLSDPRVTYWEPAKWIAKLRELSTSGAPMLLRIDMEAGHGGASGRFEYLKDPALVQAFALWAIERRNDGAANA
jgi:oligopeptidase B